MSNADKLTARDEVKFVITDRADFEWAVEQARVYKLAQRVNAVLISPVLGMQMDGLSLRQVAQWILESGMPLRLQVQMHKLIWDPAQRGV